MTLDDASRALIRAEIRHARRRDRLVLTSWGLAVLALAGLLSLWIYRVQAAKDAAMCEIVTILTSGPAPVTGPAGDRQREILAAMQRYQGTINCG